MLYDVVVCYVMLCHAALCYVMLCYVMLCSVMLCYVVLCYAMLCYVGYWAIGRSWFGVYVLRRVQVRNPLQVRKESGGLKTIKMTVLHFYRKNHIKLMILLMSSDRPTVRLPVRYPVGSERPRGIRVPRGIRPWAPTVRPTVRPTRPHTHPGIALDQVRFLSAVRFSSAFRSLSA